MKEKVAVVTGGTKGIGRAIAEALLEGGASVVVGARTEGDVREAERALGERARGVVCDVRDAGQCSALIGAAVEAFGGVDILVNNAGVGRFDPVADLSIADWDAVIETNLNGVFYCSRAAIPHLKDRGGGWIINIGSLAGKNAFPNGAAYNASKFGLIGFSEALMQEVRHDGIRVSYIMPGSVATPGFSSGEAEWKIQPEDIGRIVMDLLATPERTLPSRIEVRPSRPPKK
ncbi:MAG: SDR family oxidoreductase [Gemmatimonadetes bacterium]|nr:SDR family oxidoreductase [Gemmatimonadota bacterium]